MPTIIENKGGNFVPHPEGRFLAVVRDTYLHERKNPWKGLPRDRNNPDKGVDERDTITELVIEFLTEHQVDVGDGKMMPGYVRYTATASVAENSNLRKFLKGWFPKLKDEDFKRFDADKLIGKGADITIVHNESKGNTYANVVLASLPRPTDVIPTIPSDFVRKELRDQRAKEEANVKAVVQTVSPIAEDDPSDLPF